MILVRNYYGFVINLFRNQPMDTIIGLMDIFQVTAPLMLLHEFIAISVCRTQKLFSFFFILLFFQVIVTGCAVKGPSVAQIQTRLTNASSSIRRAEKADTHKTATPDIHLASEKFQLATLALQQHDYSRARQLAEQALVDAHTAEIKAKVVSLQSKVHEVQKSLPIVLSILPSPEVQVLAPLEMEEVDIALVEAENAVKAGVGQQEVEHLAYIARRKSTLAKEIAALRNAEQALVSVNAARKQMLYKAHVTEIQDSLALTRKKLSAAGNALRQKKLRQSLEEELTREKKLRQKVEEELRLEEQLAALQSGRDKGGLIVTLEDDLFECGKSNLKPDASSVIERLAVFLNETHQRKVQILGFTDSVGSGEDNLNLAIHRTRSVREALGNRGVPPERILIEGYRDDSNIAVVKPVEGIKSSRRIDIIISDEKGEMPEGEDTVQ